jgi:hypothetical protein
MSCPTQPTNETMKPKPSAVATVTNTPHITQPSSLDLLLDLEPLMFDIKLNDAPLQQCKM